MPSYEFEDYIELFKDVIYNTLHKIKNTKLEENVVIREQPNMNYIILELLKEDEIKELSEYLKDEKNLKYIIKNYFKYFYKHVKKDKTEEDWSLVISGFEDENKNKHIGLIVYRTKKIPRNLKTKILGDFRSLFKKEIKLKNKKLNDSLKKIKDDIEKFLINNNENDILNKTQVPKKINLIQTEVSTVSQNNLNKTQVPKTKTYANIVKGLKKTENTSVPISNSGAYLVEAKKKLKPIKQNTYANVLKKNIKQTEKNIKQTEKKKTKSVPTSKSGAYLVEAKKKLKPIEQKNKNKSVQTKPPQPYKNALLKKPKNK